MISTELLRHFGFLAGVSEDLLHRLAMISTERHFDAGAAIFAEGDDANHMYLIRSGEVNVMVTIGSGERRVVDTIVSGELLGWSALSEPRVFHFDGVANTAATLIEIDALKLGELIEADHDFGFRVMSGVATAMSQRLVGSRVQLARQEA